jgi:hypothetical protein
MPAFADLDRMITGYWLSQAIYAAAKFGIADSLARGPKSVDDLAQQTSTSPGALCRLLRALASVGIFAEGPPRMFSLTPLSGERASGGSQPTNATLLAESQAKMKSLSGTVEPGEQQVSAGDIDGLAYAATVVGDKQTTYYAMWVATHNGYSYKLAVYGDKHDEPAIDAAMASFVHGIKPLRASRVAYRNNRNKSTTR